jgi:hypothetical protein
VPSIAQVDGELDTKCVPLFSLERFVTKHFIPSKIVSNYTRYEFRYAQKREYGVHYYLLTAWSRVLLENLAGFQPVKKFPTFYGTRRFITALSSARHLSQSRARSMQSTSHPASWTSIIILSSHLCLDLPNRLFPSGLPIKNQNLYMPFPPHTYYMSRPSHSTRFYHLNNVGWGVQIMKLLIM